MTIPLDPGAGGQSVGAEALQIADLLVSTTPEKISGVIRAGTLSPVSHARLYIGGGQVVEAVADGVVLAQLSDVLPHDRLCVAYRMPGLSQRQRLAVRDYVGRQLGAGYDYRGAAAAGLGTPVGRALTAASGTVPSLVALTVRIAGGQKDRFFCSELVLEAFKNAGIPLSVGSPQSATPGNIADAWAAGSLDYVGHLKA